MSEDAETTSDAIKVEAKPETATSEAKKEEKAASPSDAATKEVNAEDDLDARAAKILERLAKKEAEVAAENAKNLPADITADEKRDFERTGTLELYDLRREADKIAKEKIKLRGDLAAAAETETQKRILREQIQSDRPKAAESTAVVVLPADANEMERKDFERTGTLELYNLSRDADRVQRERIKLRQELAERDQVEAHKRALRHQAEMDRLSLEHEREKLALPPPKDPFEGSKPIPGSNNLPEIVKGVLRRLFGYGSGEWTESNQIGLVNMLLALGPGRSQAWAHEMSQAFAADVYHSADLSPYALLKGSTGLKAIAGPLMNELKALPGADDRSLPALSDGSHRRKTKKGKRRDGIIEVEATKVREGKLKARRPKDEDDDHEEVIDDAPNQDAENIHDPWGEFD